MCSYGLRLFQIHLIDIEHVTNNIPDIDDRQVSCRCSLMVRIRLKYRSDNKSVQIMT